MTCPSTGDGRHRIDCGCDVWRDDQDIAAVLVRTHEDARVLASVTDTRPRIVTTVADVLQQLMRVPGWATQLDASDQQVTITITRQENDK